MGGVKPILEKPGQLIDEEELQTFDMAVQL